MAFSYAVIWALQMLASCWFFNSVQAMNTVIEERELFIKVQGVPGVLLFDVVHRCHGNNIHCTKRNW